MKILFLGDVMGKAGRKAIADYLPRLREKRAIDFVVVNVENAAGGFGTTPEILSEIYALGVDVVTGGNHTFDKKELLPSLTSDNRALRPANYPPGTAGKGYAVYEKNGKRIAVLNGICRLFMEPFIDCPFQYARKHHKTYRLGEDYDALIIDYHGEATSEKAALANLWDGKASLVVGTHTHVPTADGRILPRGTAFQTDAGMCGSYDSIIGVEVGTGMPRYEYKARHPLAQIANGPGTMCGVIVTVNERGLADGIEPVRMGGVLSETKHD